MAQARGITTIVDGAHAFNQFPFKVSDFNLRFLRRQSAQMDLRARWHRIPLCPQVEHQRDLAADGRRRTPDDSIRKFEEIGTYPAANFDSICEAITFNQNIGIDRKAARLRYLRERWATSSRRIRR